MTAKWSLDVGKKLYFIFVKYYERNGKRFF